MYQEIQMAEAAFNIAEKFGFTQMDQDMFAINSHVNALNSKKYLIDEIVNIGPENTLFDPYARNLNPNFVSVLPNYLVR